MTSCARVVGSGYYRTPFRGTRNSITIATNGPSFIPHLLERKDIRASPSGFKPNLGELACSCLHGPWLLQNDLSAGQGTASQSRLMCLLSYFTCLKERVARPRSPASSRSIPRRSRKSSTPALPTSSDADVVPVLAIFTTGSTRVIRLKVCYHELLSRSLLECDASYTVLPQSHLPTVKHRVELTAWYHGGCSSHPIVGAKSRSLSPEHDALNKIISFSKIRRHLIGNSQLTGAAASQTVRCGRVTSTRYLSPWSAVDSAAQRPLKPSAVAAPVLKKMFGKCRTMMLAMSSP